jgi:hypothetical protein
LLVATKPSQVYRASEMMVQFLQALRNQPFA